MFDFSRDRNMQFALGELCTYLELEKDEDKRVFLRRVYTDLAINYGAIVIPLLKETIKVEDKSEEEIDNED